MNQARLIVNDLQKDFVLHTQNKATIPVFKQFSATLRDHQCLVLAGPSGMGKSTLIKCLYGNYSINQGDIRVMFDDGEINLASCEPQTIHYLRRYIIGYVSQFLRVIPRVSTLDIVMEPLVFQGIDEDIARTKAMTLLERLHIPQSLWSLSPTTFSGGEQQRVNIARGFIADFPILLLDEPTASLDKKNRDVVVELIEEAKTRGAAIAGIFHDQEVRDYVSDETIDLTEFVA